MKEHTLWEINYRLNQMRQFPYLFKGNVLARRLNLSKIIHRYMSRKPSDLTVKE